MSKDLTTQDTTAIVPFNIATPSEQYLEDMKGVKVEYPKLKIPTGGTLFFDIDGEPCKELTAIILYKRPQRVYYELSIDESNETNNPPDCSSNDFKTGYKRIPDALEGEPQFETCTCEGCPFAEWGSAGRGKACKERAELFILLEGNLLPIRFSLSVTSKTTFDQYMTKLANKGQRYCNVITKISLSKQTTSFGKKIDYARAEFNMLRTLTESEQYIVNEMQNTIKAVINA